MFAIDCPTHQSPVLVTDRRIRSLHNTDAGIIMDVECWCGTHVVLVTGRKATEQLAIAIPAEALASWVRAS